MSIYLTFLYIKQHSITGLKYFGKTTRDPYTYNGSGKHWKLHIKKHGKEHVETLWVSEPFIDSVLISEYALAFSKENNIVESKDWANLIEENGLDGSPKGTHHSVATKASISAGLLCSPHKEETKAKHRAAMLGNTIRKGYPAPNKGVPHTTETLAKLSTNNGSKIKYQCPHCDKLVGGKGNLNRYHGDNCKSKNPGIPIFPKCVDKTT